MDRITGKIFIGDCKDARNFQQIQTEGITAVLNVASDLDIEYPKNVEHPDRYVIEYNKVGLFDGPENRRDTLIAAVSALAQLLERHSDVLVHCHGGVSRSATVVALYLALKYQVSFDDGLALVKTHRSKANPTEGISETARSIDLAMLSWRRY